MGLEQGADWVFMGGNNGGASMEQIGCSWEEIMGVEEGADLVFRGGNNWDLWRNNRCYGMIFT